MLVPLAMLQELMAFHYERRERLFRFLAAIKPEDLVRPMNVGWESMQGLLVHCLHVEEIWVQYVVQKRGRPEVNPADYRELPSIVRLSQEVRSRTEAFIAGLTDESLGHEATVTYSSGTTLHFSVGKALLHVMNHDAHHLGQVTALARQLGYAPPELDLL